MDCKKKTVIYETNSTPPKNYIWVKSDGNAYEYNYQTRSWEKSSISGENECCNENRVFIVKDVSDVEDPQEGDIAIIENKWETSSGFIPEKCEYKVEWNPDYEIDEDDEFTYYGPDAKPMPDSDMRYSFEAPVEGIAFHDSYFTVSKKNKIWHWYDEEVPGEEGNEEYGYYTITYDGVTDEAVIISIKKPITSYEYINENWTNRSSVQRRYSDSEETLFYEEGDIKKSISREQHGYTIITRIEDSGETVMWEQELEQEEEFDPWQCVLSIDVLDYISDTISIYKWEQGDVEDQASDDKWIEVLRVIPVDDGVFRLLDVINNEDFDSFDEIPVSIFESKNGSIDPRIKVVTESSDWTIYVSAPRYINVTNVYEYFGKGRYIRRPHSNWDEEDEASMAYIENKPMVLGIFDFGVNILDEGTLTVEDANAIGLTEEIMYNFANGRYVFVKLPGKLCSVTSVTGYDVYNGITIKFENYTISWVDDTITISIS